MANGAPLGVSDYKYGLRVSVIALRSPPQWLTPEGLKLGGPRAFGWVIVYSSPSFTTILENGTDILLESIRIMTV